MSLSSSSIIFIFMISICRARSSFASIILSMLTIMGLAITDELNPGKAPLTYIRYLDLKFTPPR